MNKKDIDFKKLPDAPGVYLFRNAKRKILYIGKATSLRNRVRSYFSADLVDTRGSLLVKMLEEARSVTWEQTDSVLEALILEANLIKKHQPFHNTRDKDNKSFNYLVITNEELPRVLVVRGRELFSSWSDRNAKYLFGPFTKGGALKEALTIVRKIFPFRDACAPCPRAPLGQEAAKKAGAECKPCFNRQIGLCPGVCSGEISKADYAKRITHIRLLFEGRKKRLLTQLATEMKQLARAQEFEQADIRKRQLFALTHINETALLGSEYQVSTGGESGRIEAYDVAHISETARVGVMVVVEDGSAQKAHYRKFTIQSEQKGDIAGLQEILRRRFNHSEWKLPSLLVIDGGVAQKNATQRVLDEFGYKLPIVNVVKNEKHKAGRLVGNRVLIEKSEREILLANQEAHRFAISFHRQKRRKTLR